MNSLKSVICLNCGGDVVVSKDTHTATCRYCKREYQIESSLQDSSLIDFSLATEYWKTFRFADAKRKFLDVTKQNPDFSEAYFGAVLSEYGIEWGTTRFGDIVPTCHRAHNKCIFDDENYIQALKYSSNKEELQDKANKIERIRKEIIQKSNNDEPYDIFICFKATEIDDERKRTIDFDLGRDLYQHLVGKGYKVFFSPETLLNIREQEFEPYIYRALSTAKVMFLLCSSNEEIESPWVKNEWDRFLDMHSSNGLIPICGNKYEKYLPIELPLELRKLNALEYDINLLTNIDKKVASYFSQDEPVIIKRQANTKFEKIIEAQEQEKIKFDPLHKHIWKTEVIPATCKDKGYTRYYCDCGEEYISDQTDFGEHKFKLTKRIDPLCDKEGQEVYTCSLCGEMKIDKIPALGHTYGLWKTTKYPTCETAGEKARQCEVCGYIEREEIQACGHTYGEWIEQKHATCEKEGSRVRQCENCGKLETQIVSATGHNFNAWALSKDDLEKEQRICKDCGKVETRPKDIEKYKKKKRTTIISLSILLVITLFFSVFIPVYLTNAPLDTVRQDGITFTKLSDGTYEVISMTNNKVSEIVIPNTIRGVDVTSIGDRAFYGCTWLENIQIPDSVTSIGEYAFYKCTGLTSIEIPSSITSIESSAFIDCYKLVEVINKSNLSVNYALITHSEESKIKIVNGYQFITADDTNYLFGYNGTDTSLILPENYNGQSYIIYQYAFYNCDKLISIVIPNSVTEIGDYAFFECNKLTSLVVGSGLKSFGYKAVYGCSSLESIEIPFVGSVYYESNDTYFGYIFGATSYSNNNNYVPSSLREVKITNTASIDECAFYGCNNITSIEIPNGVTRIGSNAFDGCTGLTSIEIPNSVTSIGSSAFYGCTGLTSIEIPSSVTSIGEYAFYGCGNLTSIKYSGTKEQWKATIKGSKWNYKVSTTVVHCTDGDVSI